MDLDRGGSPGIGSGRNLSHSSGPLCDSCTLGSLLAGVWSWKRSVDPQAMRHSLESRTPTHVLWHASSRIESCRSSNIYLSGVVSGCRVSNLYPTDPTRPRPNPYRTEVLISNYVRPRFVSLTRVVTDIHATSSPSSPSSPSSAARAISSATMAYICSAASATEISCTTSSLSVVAMSSCA